MQMNLSAAWLYAAAIIPGDDPVPLLEQAMNSKNWTLQTVILILVGVILLVLHKNLITSWKEKLAECASKQEAAEENAGLRTAIVAVNVILILILLFVLGSSAFAWMEIREFIENHL